MRIVGGSARGRPLKAPRSREIRPTADRVRETLFNLLGQRFEGGAALDLYAGTGALGLEALSRGMDRAVLVDSGREALSLCRANAEALGFSDRVEILAGNALGALGRLATAEAHFELIFADPPYAARALSELLEGIEEHALLAEGGTVVIEHDRREEAPERLGGWDRADQRAFGDTRVSLFRRARA